MTATAALARLLVGLHLAVALRKGQPWTRGKGRATNGNVSLASSDGVGQRGQVHGIYTFGSPAFASPAFVNPLAADGCFPGLRAWTYQDAKLGHWTDAVAMITGSLGFRHAMQEGWRMNVKTDTGELFPCSTHRAEGPWGWPSWRLHDGLAYLHSATEATPTWVQEVANIGLNHSYERDPREAAALIRPLGWRLVGLSLHPGTAAVGGPQPSLLMQHPETLKCIVTFQGTAGVKDWLSNFQVDKVHFCGFTETDEECTGKVCEVRHPGGAFVHEGFRNHWRRIVQHESWQAEIRPHLGGCSEVHATGHSLGGVLSELLAGCAAKRLHEGDYGWNDAKWITWTKETPRRLPYKYDEPHMMGSPDE